MTLSVEVSEADFALLSEVAEKNEQSVPELVATLLASDCESLRMPMEAEEYAK